MRLRTMMALSGAVVLAGLAGSSMAQDEGAVQPPSALRKCIEVGGDQGQLTTILREKFEAVHYYGGLAGNNVPLALPHQGPLDAWVCNVDEVPGSYTVRTDSSPNSGYSAPTQLAQHSCHPLRNIVDVKLIKSVAWDACVWMRIRY